MQPPFSSADPGVQLFSLDSNWNCALDFENPQGVSLVRKKDVASFWPSQYAELRQSPAQPFKVRTLNVWLHLVNACNLACFYCYIPNLVKGASPHEVNLQSFKAENIAPTIDAFMEYARNNGFARLHIKFAGGEPTIRPDLIKLFCETAYRLETDVRVSFGIVTNGVFDEGLDSILKENKIRVSISCDGVGKSHDQIRFIPANHLEPRTGTWDTVVRTIERLQALGIRPYLLHTLTPANIDRLDEFAKFAIDHFCGFRLSLVRLPSIPTEQMIERFTNNLTRLYEWLPDALPLSRSLERDAKFAEWNLTKRKQSACGSCRNYVALGINSQISSCQMTMHDPVGSLQNDSLATIMERFGSLERYQTLRNPDRKLGGCVTCELFRVCGGGCPQHTRMVFGIPDRPSPWCRVYGLFLPHYVTAVGRHMLRRYLAVSDNLQNSPRCT